MRLYDISVDNRIEQMIYKISEEYAIGDPTYNDLFNEVGSEPKEYKTSDLMYRKIDISFFDKYNHMRFCCNSIHYFTYKILDRILCDFLRNCKYNANKSHFYKVRKLYNKALERTRFQIMNGLYKFEDIMEDKITIPIKFTDNDHLKNGAYNPYEYINSTDKYRFLTDFYND